jgi:predicted dinucleotide-utilizing enzyme
LKHAPQRPLSNLNQSKQKLHNLLSFLLKSPLKDLLKSHSALSKHNRALLINLQANHVRHSVLPLADLDLTTAHDLPINHVKLALHHPAEAITAAADIALNRREKALQAFPKDINLDLSALPLIQVAADSALVLLADPAVEHLVDTVQDLPAVPEDLEVLVQEGDIVLVHRWIV